MSLFYWISVTAAISESAEWKHHELKAHQAKTKDDSNALRGGNCNPWQNAQNFAGDCTFAGVYPIFSDEL
jgi:hypothetical protein